MKIFTLIRAFQKAKGRSPTPSELAQLKKQADSIPERGKFLQFPPGGKGRKGPNKIMDESVDEQGNYIGDRIPGMDKEGNFVEDIREFTRKEDLYEGNKKGLEKLLKSGAVKKGVAPKTKPRDVNQEIRDLVAADEKASKRTEDFKSFEKRIKSMSLEQRAAERAQDLNMSLEDALKIEMKKQNKKSAFNIAFKRYKDIDKKPLELNEVISIYTNLNKYPKGRSIIFGDIAEIERGYILPNIGNRSREMLVNKLNKMVVAKKQPNPFKKAADEVSEQIEMDFTDWDPKGMSGGGIVKFFNFLKQKLKPKKKKDLEKIEEGYKFPEAGDKTFEDFRKKLKERMDKRQLKDFDVKDRKPNASGGKIGSIVNVMSVFKEVFKNKYGNFFAKNKRYPSIKERTKLIDDAEKEIKTNFPEEYAEFPNPSQSFRTIKGSRVDKNMEAAMERQNMGFFPMTQEDEIRRVMDRGPGMNMEEFFELRKALKRQDKAGGGLAYMLGYAEGGEVNPIALRKKLMELVTAMQTAPEEEIPMLALEARRIRDQLAKFEQEEPSIMEAAEEMQEGPMTLEERIKEKIYPKEEVTSDATIYAPGTITSTTGGEKVIDDQITINKLARIPNYMNMKRPVRASMMSGRLQPSTKGLEALKQLIKGDITEGDPRNYEKGGRVPMMYGGDPGFAFEYGGSWADWNDNHKHMMPVTEYISTKLPKDRLPFRQEFSDGGSAGLPAIQIGPVGINPRASGSYSSNQPYGPNYKEKTLSNTVGFDATIDLPGGFKLKGNYDKYRTKDRLYDTHGNFLDKRVRDDHDRYNVGVEWSKKFANGGRIGFDNGGFNKGRRNFLKLAAGLASVPFIGKFFKAAKPAAKAVKAVETSNAAGMPAWFPKLVDKVMKEGKDLGGTVERQIVKEVELPSGTKVVVDHDLTTGNTIVDVGMGKHGFSSGRYGQPARLELTKGEWIEPDISKSGKVKGKGTKTKDEFFVEEAEFTGGHPENIKFEESSIERYGDHASDFSEVEKYATGKNVDKYNIKGTRKSEADEFAQGRAEAQADEWQPDWDDSLPEDYAKGGLAHMLGR